MDFYTREWHEYIEENWKDCLSKKISDIDIYVADDYAYDVDDLIENRFEIYYKRKQQYVNMYLDLEKKFDKYEVLENKSYDEEFDLYKKKIEDFVNINMNKLQSIIDKLKMNGFEINVNYADVDYYLLAMNMTNNKNREIYKEILSIYEKNIDKYENLSKEELQSVRYAKNNVNAFLTNYDEYLELRGEKEEYFNNQSITFVGGIITRYELINKNLVIEFQDGKNINQINRFTLKNVKITEEIYYDDLHYNKEFLDSIDLSVDNIFYGYYGDFESSRKLEICILNPPKKYFA